jgi:hypothetical protein
MKGDDQVRYCPECNLNVYDFSAMTAPDVQRLVTSHEGRLCGRLFRRADGTILTKDCPVGFSVRVRRVSRIAGAALSAAMGFGAAAAQTTKGTSAPLVQISCADQKESAGGIAVEVVDATGAVITNARVLVLNGNNDIIGGGGTDFSGRFRCSGLKAGVYRLKIESPGFHDAVVNDLTITDSEKSVQAPLKVSMDVGIMGEIISVPGDALMGVSHDSVTDTLPFAV